MTVMTILKTLCVYEDWIYHVVNFIQLFYLLCFCMYASFHYDFRSRVYCFVHIKMHTYVIKGFLQCLQDSYCQYDRVQSHQNQTQYVQVLTSQNLLFDYHAAGFIHCNVNNKIILLLPVKFLSWYGIVPTALIRYTFNILRTRIS